MKRPSRSSKTRQPDESIVRQSRRRSSNSSSMVFSQIPRAALVESSLNQFVFQRETPSRPNLFQPATSQCDYVQYQPIFPIQSQKTINDSLDDAESSKRQHFWRVLEHNNIDGSRKSSNSQSSIQFQKTSKKWSFKKEESQPLQYQIIKQEEEMLELKTQTSAQNQIIQPRIDKAIKKSNSFSISNKQVDFKVTPKHKEREEYPDVGQDQPNKRKHRNVTVEKKVTFAAEMNNKNKRRFKFVHQRITERKMESESGWYQKINYFEWNEAFFLNKQQQTGQRKSRFPMRKNRIRPLLFWVGERIVYRMNEDDGIWLRRQK